MIEWEYYRRILIKKSFERSENRQVMAIEFKYEMIKFEYWNAMTSTEIAPSQYKEKVEKNDWLSV